MHVWAEDAAGNRTEVGFWIKALPREFRKRQINITDSFIQKVTPEIVAYSPEISGGETLQETFLTVNRDLRAINNQRIVELTKESASRILWNEPFKQLTNSKVEAVFADRRSYFYKGEKCDEQTHLGFDLASLARSPVEASNAGSVVYADYLGIYGNTVIIDHGLGLFSLYGHLSSLEVAVGEQVVKGQALGLTGQTGLAGGDHLHFSMILQGVQITPIEWWDESWVQLHVLSKLDYSDSAVAQ
jgi:murein DD-endopeptidase MepM/ murein hydrolase activator NlpD